VGYASSRAHNNNDNNIYNNNSIFARARRQTRPVARVWLFIEEKLKHGFKRCTCCSCFHNSNGVLETIAQGVRIEGGLCEFARAQQQDQSFGFGFHHELIHGLTCCTCRSCFHYSNGVPKTITQGVRIEDEPCELVRAPRQRDQSLGYGFSYIEIQTWLQVLHLLLVFFITPTASSKPSRRAFGLKVGYASSRAHNNKTSRSGLGFIMN
jgi:hypothetical protein